jgi:hypothetical protein
MPLLAEFITPLLGATFGGFAAYVAIRSDLENLKARMLNVEQSTVRAHDRIDERIKA